MNKTKIQNRYENSSEQDTIPEIDMELSLLIISLEIIAYKKYTFCSKTTNLNVKLEYFFICI